MGKKTKMNGGGCGFSRMNRIVPEPDLCEEVSTLEPPVTTKETKDTITFTVNKKRLDESYNIQYNEIHKELLNKLSNPDEKMEQLYKPLALLGDYMGYSNSINEGLSHVIKSIAPPIQIDTDTMSVNVQSQDGKQYMFNLYTFLYYVLTYYNQIKNFNEDLTTNVYHGTCKWNADIVADSIITLKSFLSTSLNISVAMKFTTCSHSQQREQLKTVFAITGVNNSYINLGNVVETEILLPIGSRLKITNIKTKNITIITPKNEKTHTAIRVIECELLSDDLLIDPLLKICKGNINQGYIAEVYDDGNNFYDPQTDENLSCMMKKVLLWRYENIWQYISKSCAPDKKEPEAIGESTELPLKRRKTDPKPERTFYELDNSIGIVTPPHSGGGGTQSIGKIQFKCTPANKIKIPLSTAHKLHILLGFKNDTRLLGKERKIQGNKRQYILITPNEAKKLHQRWLKRQ